MKKSDMKKLANAVRVFAVYDGSMIIGRDGNQSYLQTYDTLVAIGYNDGQSQKTIHIDKNEITESEYESIKVTLLKN